MSPNILAEACCQRMHTFTAPPELATHAHPQLRLHLAAITAAGVRLHAGS
jgi:hypothetical protein